MKTFKIFGIALMAVLVCLNLTSCNKEDNPITPEEGEYVTVGLGVTGEYVEFTDSPLTTRAEEDLQDLIGIEVYTLSESGAETKYAYGIFTSLNNVKIKLLKGQKYQFRTSIIVNGYGCPEHLGHKEYYNNIHTCLGFGNGHATSTDFIYTSDFSLANFSTMNSNYGDAYNHDRFYGELAEYSPSETGTVTIATKRRAYGAHYIAEGLTEGKLKVDVTKRNSCLYSVEIPYTNPELDGIYSFSDLRYAWQKDNYSSTKQLYISWIKDDESVTSLGTFDVTFKRNVRTTIRIKLGEDTSIQNGIVITREDQPLTDDENEYVIEGGEVTEVPVTNQQ